MFVGASFSRFPGYSGDLYFELYRDGVLVWTSTPGSSADPTLTFYASGYTGLVDEVRVRSLGGSMTAQGSGWIMDNLVFAYQQ